MQFFPQQVRIKVSKAFFQEKCLYRSHLGFMLFDFSHHSQMVGSRFQYCIQLLPLLLPLFLHSSSFTHRASSLLTTPHRTAPHRIASHRIAMNRIALHRIAWHRIAFILSHHIASPSHRIASHRIASHRVGVWI